MHVTIDLQGDCLPACQELVDRTYAQLNSPTYSVGASVLELPASIEAWRSEHRTARKRAARAARLGYRFEHACDWSRHSDDIHAINTSLAERQGRPMTQGYLERREHGPLPDQPCDRHRAHTYGVLTGRTLVAYMSLYRVGQLAHISMILGHGDHLANDVMYLLAAGMIEHQIPLAGFAFYNRYDSGTDGLRYFKDRVGFKPCSIEWAR